MDLGWDLGWIWDGFGVVLDTKGRLGKGRGGKGREGKDRGGKGRREREGIGERREEKGWKRVGEGRERTRPGEGGSFAGP